MFKSKNKQPENGQVAINTLPNPKRFKEDHVYESPPITQQTEEDDDDDMFGDDIAIEELDISAIIAKKNQLETTASDIFEELPLDELGEVLLKAENNVQETTIKLETISQSNTAHITTATAASTAVKEEQTTVKLETVSGTNSGTLTVAKERRKKFTRYVVANVTHEIYSIEGSAFTEKVLVLLQENDNTSILAKLRHEWEQTKVVVGDFVHIPFTQNTSEIIIDNKHNFIIVNPDHLVSCTAVADSYSCLRKSVMQLKVKGPSEYTEALVHGNIIHKVLQNALQTGQFSVRKIKEEMQSVILDSLEDLYAMDQDEETAYKIISEYAGSISQFGSTFLKENPLPNARPSTDLGFNPAKELNYESISICNVLDIEEHLWSPTYGLKGMVDASIQMKLSPTNKVLTVPFELKTGKTSRFLTNRAQTLLYILLMSDRYDIDIGAGVLYYSKTNSLYLVPTARNDLRSLIMARNYLAIASKMDESIPPMIQNSHTCQYCYINDACTIYHKAVENGNGATSGLYKLFEDKTDHMTESTCTFFRHWWKLLEKEETDVNYIRKDIWSQPAEIRELTGRCLSNMVLNLSDSRIDPTTAQWRYAFIRDPAEIDRPLLCNISVGDPVVVSSMDGHVNLAMGFVSKLSASEIILNLTEPLRNPPQTSDDFDPVNNQTFNQFIHCKDDAITYYSRTQVKYRIDKDDMDSGMSMLRNNLVMLVAKSPQNERLRELIIDLKKPSYHTGDMQLPPTPHMNPDQRNALKRVLQAKDYSLILGMPGTGKTTTTAEIIHYLVKQNKTVLVAAYTHTALDNVLMKVRAHGIDVLRLGNRDKVMPSMRDCMPSADNSIKTVKEMKEFHESKKVVGVTCLGIGNVLLQKRTFDYCIIDEASQITLPTCIGPLRYARTFVLVGDSYQLPPIVKNKDALEGGLDKSLFSILAEARPESISYLEYQYRMNKEIMEVANLLIYGGKLKCGNYQVASKSLQIPGFEDGLKPLHEMRPGACLGASDCWLKHVIDPSRKVVFLNTDYLPGKESRPIGSFIQNVSEANLIHQTAEALLSCGMTESQLAVVSVYRSQLRVISNLLKGRQNLEIATIDKYQGRDKSCVILSLVRNNSQGNAGDLLRDWRRLNVAITRAESKLIMFGSASTLKSSALYGHLLEYFEKKGWIFNLPTQAESVHSIPKYADENTHVKENNGEKRKPKTFFPTNVVLNRNEILKDIYQNSI